MRKGFVIAAALGALLAPTTAQAVDYAPVDRAGPALSVPQSELDASLNCSPGLEAATRAPVLLIHGTGSDPDHNYSWNWVPALDALGIKWCTVALVEKGMADIQVSAEHVVNAIRAMYQQSGRKIAVLGHSQGGMIPRWALRFWPDTRAMVDDVVGFAPSNHGTDSTQVTCGDECAPAAWQQGSNSEFITALNSFQETFGGVSYTVVYTYFDVFVTPNQNEEAGSSSLRTGDGQITNVAVQEVCPTDVTDHLAIGTVDNVAYSLAIDALDNAGPADPTRLAPTEVCANPFHPGVDPETAPAEAAEAGADVANSYATAESVPEEPELRCYVLAAGCTAGAPDTAAEKPAAKGKPKKKKKKRKKKRKHRR